MNDTHLKSPEAIRKLLPTVQSADIRLSKEEDRYRWIARTLQRVKYFHLRRRDKTSVLKYMREMTGYSRQHLTRLIAEYSEKRWIGGRHTQRNKFPKKYTYEDVILLAKTDEQHQTLSGPTTKKLFERAFEVYEDRAYIRLKDISVSHIYNLRQSTAYTRHRRNFTKTTHSSVKIGERRKPDNKGQPGYIRIDTVHQGDQDKEKGVYHINAVDELSQFEIVCSVEKISEAYLIPVLEFLIDAFPFLIKGFHSDNGSEYVNHRVLQLLNKLLIEFTKSRARHSNDNALVESKNGSIIRKHMGYSHIKQKWAGRINEFYQNHLNPYLNYHRPCYFATIIINEKGREKKQYLYENIMTPYEKLKSLPDAVSYLKPGIFFGELDKLVLSMTDLEAAKQMNIAKRKLFAEIYSDIG